MNLSQSELYFIGGLITVMGSILAWTGRQMISAVKESRKETIIEIKEIAKKLTTVDKDLSNIFIKIDGFNNRVSNVEKKIEDQQNSIMNNKEKIHKLEIEMVKNKE